MKRTFSQFIRSASDDEKAETYNRVLTQATKDQQDIGAKRMSAADRLEQISQYLEDGGEHSIRYETEAANLLRNVAALVRACEDDKIALYRYDRDDVLAALAKLQEGE